MRAEGDAVIRIKVELVPFGVGKPREIARAEIANDGTGTRARGNYRVTLWRKQRRPWREVRVRGFPRLRLSVWHLLARALDRALAPGAGGVCPPPPRGFTPCARAPGHEGPCALGIALADPLEEIR